MITRVFSLGSINSIKKLDEKISTKKNAIALDQLASCKAKLIKSKKTLNKGDVL